MCDTGRVYELVLNSKENKHDPNGLCETASVTGEDITQVLTGTFFWVTTQTLSAPRTAMLVMPDDLTALKAYSAASKLALATSQTEQSISSSTASTHRGNTDQLGRACPPD